jgi:hypothetical protein
MLKERNCGKLFLAISHITVPEINPSLMLEFDMVFTTNSKYNGYGYKYGVDTPYESQSILDKKLKIYNLI